jgi:cytochrome P450
MGRPLYDLGAPDFADRSIEIYRQMRDEQPLYADPSGRFFAVTRYRDVLEVLGDSKRFSNEGVSTSLASLPILQQIDAPLHDELRALVTTAFTPRRIAELEPFLRTKSRELLSRFAGRGECDLMAEYARHLPSMAIGEMLGIPPETREPMLEWTESLIAISANGDQAVERAALAISEVFQELLAARRREPCDDLMTALIEAEIDGGRKLSEQELLGFCFQLVLAGNDTTTNLIANGSVLLARNPDQRRELVQDASLVPNAVEEMMRIESPTQVLPRRLLCDVDLYGVLLPAESELRLIYAAANRDERFFPEPDRFDIHRKNARRHLALGHGLHFCLGAALARLEAKIALEELLAFVPEFELAEDPSWIPSAWARAHPSVQLCFEPSSRRPLEAVA